MYWDARRLHMHGKNEEAKQAYSAAAENARQHGLEAEAVVAEALILAVDGELDQAEAKVGAALDDSRLRLPELAWFTRGWLEYRRKDYDRAIRFYRKALATPGFEVPGRARNNMGVAYARKGNYDRAIACYREALAEPKHDAAGDAWSNMGNALAAKKDYDQAIKCYRKALAIPGYGAFGNAWYGLGLVFAKKGRLHEAVENWKRAGALFRKQGADDFAERAEQKIAAARTRSSLRRYRAAQRANEMTGRRIGSRRGWTGRRIRSMTRTAADTTRRSAKRSCWRS
jgi:tetratricopeptide (TPR) repeat protein